MNPGSNKSNRTVLAVIFSCIALCCMGGGILGWFGYKSGTAAVAQDSLFVSAVAKEMSDSNYQLDKILKFFVSDYTDGLNSRQFQITLDEYREGLGKFVSLGAVTSVRIEKSNGEVVHTETFNAKYEKGDELISVIILNPGSSQQKLQYWKLGSEAFKKLSGSKLKQS